jgi:hypothetical protein
MEKIFLEWPWQRKNEVSDHNFPNAEFWPVRKRGALDCPSPANWSDLARSTGLSPHASLRLAHLLT